MSCSAAESVNRVRYYEKRHGKAKSVPFRVVVTTASLLRINQSRHRVAMRFLLDRSRWTELPKAVPAPEVQL